MFQAYQALHSEYVSVVQRLYKFHNVNASSIRTIMVANCPQTKATPNNDCTVTECSRAQELEKASQKEQKSEDNQGIHFLTDHAQARSAGPIEYNMEYRKAESDRIKCSSENGASSRTSSWLALDASQHACGDEGPSDLDHTSTSVPMETDLNSATAASDNTNISPEVDTADYIQANLASFNTLPSSQDTNTISGLTTESAKYEKLLIFTTGKKTYTPHQIGVKRIQIDAAEGNDLMMTTDHGRNQLVVDEEPEQPVDEEDGEPREDFDSIDHLIELHGHIIGMCLSPDQRYILFVYVSYVTDWSQFTHLSQSMKYYVLNNNCYKI